MTDPLAGPFRLGQNRVERFYTGGELLERFRGLEPAADSNRPEDWVGSVTSAWRPSGTPETTEGLSRVTVDGAETLLRDVLGAAPVDIAGAHLLSALREAGESAATTGLLVKLLDTAVRLPVHCHPTREFARRNLASFFGKTEAWLILDTRDVVDQEPPNVRLGFRRDVARDELRRWIEERDSRALLDAMHVRDVRAGDVWLVPAGMPHAIGAGLFLVELQEPTDFSIVAETEGFPIAMENAHLGLGWDVMIDAFDRTPLDDSELDGLRQRPIRPREGDALAGTELLGAAAAPYFRAYRLAVREELALPVEPTFGVGIVLSGSGQVRARDVALDVARGTTFAVPAAAMVAPVTVVPSDRLDLLMCLPPAPAALRAAAQVGPG